MSNTTTLMWLKQTNPYFKLAQLENVDFSLLSENIVWTNSIEEDAKCKLHWCSSTATVFFHVLETFINQTWLDDETVSNKHTTWELTAQTCNRNWTFSLSHCNAHKLFVIHFSCRLWGQYLHQRSDVWHSAISWVNLEETHLSLSSTRSYW